MEEEVVLLNTKRESRNKENILKAQKVLRNCIFLCGSITAITRHAKISRNTLYRIMDGRSCSISTRIKLEDLFDQKTEEGI
jgi:DNA-binding phage protein